MARSKTAFVCTECGAQTVRWQGQCPQCQAWNTMVETVLEPAAPAAGSRFAALADPAGDWDMSADNIIFVSEPEAADFTAENPNEWLVRAVPFSDAAVRFSATAAGSSLEPTPVFRPLYMPVETPPARVKKPWSKPAAVSSGWVMGARLVIGSLIDPIPARSASGGRRLRRP